MAIKQSTLRAASTRPSVRVAKSITEARQIGLRTAFLCHSHYDVTLVDGFVKFAKEMGWNLYVDWQDTSLPDKPDRNTADKIKYKIKECDIFLFLATKNSMQSRWCPWEIGYADGVKNIEKITIIDTIDDNGVHVGSEYLQLYRRLDVAADGKLAVFDPNARMGTYVHNL